MWSCEELTITELEQQSWSKAPGHEVRGHGYHRTEGVVRTSNVDINPPSKGVCLALF